MRFFVSLIITAMGAAIVLPAAHGGEAFKDDFEEGLDKWSFTDAKAWQITDEDGDHVLELLGNSQYQPKVRSPLNIAWARDVNVGSFEMTVKVKQTGKEYGHRDMCFFFGKQDDEHFYYVHLATKADDHANSIFLVNGEPRVSIARKRTDGTIWDDQYHTVKITRDIESGAIAVYFDDMEEPCMYTEDTTFTSGTVGLGSFDDQGCFAEIDVKTPAE
jgi:hypothetical protein